MRRVIDRLNTRMICTKYVDDKYLVASSFEISLATIVGTRVTVLRKF